MTRIKISSLAGQGWSNSWFQVKFTMRLKISGLCQIPSFAGLEWSKISFLSQIFNATENFLILPNFYLCMSRVVKTINFGLNFYCDWKFLNFTKFHPSHVLSGQKCKRFNKCLCFIAKVGIDLNCWNLKTNVSIRILKFEDKTGNQSKCWNLSANRQNLSKCWYLSEKLKNNQKVDVSVQ